MTNLEIESRITSLVKEERRITRELLQLINLSAERRIHLERGFSSLFEWLVRGHGYSEAAAQRRIQAARLLSAVPEAGAKIEAGKLNLSVLARTQSAIRAQEKFSGTIIPAEEKKNALANLEEKSGSEAELTLLKLFPATQSTVFQERKTRINADTTRLAVNLPQETIDKLNRIQELLSHSLPGEKLAGVITYLADEFVKRRDPLLKANKRGTKKTAFKEDEPTSAAAKRCVKPTIPRLIKLEILKESGGRCTFRDPVSGRICGSGYQVEIDHIRPRSLGGSNQKENLRSMCRTHNIFMSEKLLGPHAAQRWRKS